MGDILKDLVKILPTLKKDERDTKREERIKKAYESFTFFCEYYLSNYFYCKPARYQEILYNVVQNRELKANELKELKSMIPLEFQDSMKAISNIKGIVAAEPREHGKSTRWTFAYPLWTALTRRSRFQLIISADKASAVLQMQAIKDSLEENERIIEDFGEQCDPKLSNKWSQDYIVLANDCAIMAKGKGGSIRGARYKEHRPDLVVVDDTLKDEEADSITSRKKVKDWFNKTVQSLGLNSLIVVVNTITHDDDLASSLINDVKNDKKVGWLALRFSAEKPNKEPLWKERYSWQDLKDKEKNLGSIAYAQEFLSKPMNDEDRIFKSSWFKTVPLAEVPDNSLIYAGIDPATGSHDQSAIVSIAKDRVSKKIYVIDAYGKTESTSKFTTRIIEKYRFYKHQRIYMEQVAFQSVYKEQIVTDGFNVGLSLPIKGVLPGRASKSIRMQALSPLIENGLILFTPKCEELIEQLINFPTGKFDDLCDALFYAVAASKRSFGVNALSYDPNKPRNWRKELKI